MKFSRQPASANWRRRFHSHGIRREVEVAPDGKEFRNVDNDRLEGTIRKTHALSIGENTVHGSDSDENAKIEIDFFFNDR